MVEDAQTVLCNQFMGLRTQRWRMYERQSIHGAMNKMVEDARTALGSQFVGLQTQWWRMHERQSIHGATNKMVEDSRTALGNQFVGLWTQWWTMHEQRLAINSWGSRLNGGGCMNDNHFLWLRIRFIDGGFPSRARQSIRGSLDSMVEDA